MKFRVRLSNGHKLATVIDAPTGFIARQWARRKSGDQTVEVTLVGEDVEASVEIQQEGSAAGARNTLRHEVRERVGKTRWTKWRVLA